MWWNWISPSLSKADCQARHFHLSYLHALKPSVNTLSHFFPILKHFWEISDKDVTIRAASHLFDSIYLFPSCLNASSFSSPGGSREAISRRGRYRRRVWSHVTWTMRRGHHMGWIMGLWWRRLHSCPGIARVISSSAFNLSMQVLRFLTFTPCASLLPLSASDGYGVELSSMRMCVCWKCTFIVYERVLVCFNCTTLCVCVRVLLILWVAVKSFGPSCRKLDLTRA